MGDRILQVNGNDVTSATHQEAVMELLRPSDDIKLFVQHDPLPVGFQVRYLSPRLSEVLCDVGVRRASLIALFLEISVNSLRILFVGSMQSAMCNLCLQN